MRANYEDLSQGIYKTEKYLLQFLLNLVLNENHALKNRELHIQFIDTINTQIDLVKAVNDPVNDPVKVAIIPHLQQNPKANYTELAEKTGNSSATIKRHIQELKKQGMLERIGSDKTGFWKLIKKPIS
jgi:predicted HTH transcriptional regulator